MLNYITLGGPIEFIYFGHESPLNLAQTLQKFLGESRMPPFYALGYF